MKLTIELRRVGSSNSSYRAIPIVARAVQGTKHGQDLLAPQKFTDVECAKEQIQQRLDKQFRGPVEIEWLDNTDAPEMPTGHHRCVARTPNLCGQLIPAELLMCSSHWRMVRGAVQRKVMVAYAGGRGVGTIAHNTAIQEAIDAVAKEDARRGEFHKR